MKRRTQRTQMDGKQTSPAAKIPEEILQQIFHLLLEYKSEVADPGYTYFSTYSPAVTQFLSIALVCTQWYYAAIPLIYTHCQVRSASSLELLCRTLSTSKELSSRIHSITNSRIDCPAAWNSWILRSFERDKRFEDTLARLCKVLAKNVNMDIEICASSVPQLVSSLETSAVMLTSLRINRGHNPCQNIGLKHGMHFPYLRSLSLEGFQFDNQIMWPNMPQLRSLRIMGCSMFETRSGLLAGLSSLVRVEFITTYFHLEAGVDLLVTSRAETRNTRSRLLRLILPSVDLNTLSFFRNTLLHFSPEFDSSSICVATFWAAPGSISRPRSPHDNATSSGRDDESGRMERP